MKIIYYLLEKITRFTGFFYRPTQSIWSVFQPKTFHPWRILQLFSLMSCIIILMSVVEAFIWICRILGSLCPHFDFPPQDSLNMRTSSSGPLNLGTLRHRVHNMSWGTSRPSPFFRTVAPRDILSWAIPMGYPISRSGDYLITWFVFYLQQKKPDFSLQ